MKKKQSNENDEKHNLDAILKDIVSFYLISLGNETLAKRASVQTLKLLKRKIKRDLKFSDEKIPFYFIQFTHKLWNKYKNKISNNFFSSFKSWNFKGNPEIWKIFYLHAAPDEFLTLIWSRILKFSEEQIAKSLEITEGTVRYRTGRALKLLGSFQNIRSIS